MGGAGNEVRRKGETKEQLFERFGQSEKVPPEPEVPDCVAHVVGWFFDLSARRGAGFAGPMAITFQDIAAWRELMDERPTPQEVQMLLAMDTAFMAALRADDEPKDDPPTSVFLRK